MNKFKVNDVLKLKDSDRLFTVIEIWQNSYKLEFIDDWKQKQIAWYHEAFTGAINETFDLVKN